ncbi:hypothetical protein ACFYPN_16930 [Streptomyces sp. NPDC005576]|uniref:ISAzo13-like element transposase-related protein n=1 Tax=Streptomyces sp. NPDC005576 TaxID=3364726 RepID=UPI0036B8C7D3
MVRPGRGSLPRASSLLICADASESNGHRSRAWRLDLGCPAGDTGQTITVCHLLLDPTTDPRHEIRETEPTELQPLPAFEVNDEIERPVNRRHHLRSAEKAGLRRQSKTPQRQSCSSGTTACRRVLPG